MRAPPWLLRLSVLPVFFVNALPQASGSSGGTSTSSSNAVASSSNATVVPLGTRAVFGLQADGMQVSSIYIGFLPDWSREDPIAINKDLGKAMAIIGDYVDVYPDDLSLSQMEWHSSSILPLKDLAVYAPAIRPRMTMDQWTDEMSQSVAKAVAALNQKGLTVWLRFAWEMNGSWNVYGQQPAAYIAAFQSLANTIRAATNETYMLWAPNVVYGDTSGIGGYSQYYPGEQYVDIAGLSLYNPASAGQVAKAGAFTSAFSSFYKLYGQAHPVVVAETGSAYTYDIPASMNSSYCSDCDISGSLPNVNTLSAVPSSSASESSIKINWLQQLVSDEAAAKFPNLTAVCFFNYFKYGSGYATDADTLVDYRVVGGQNETETQFRQIVGNVSAYQGGYSGAATRSYGIGSGAATALVPVLVALSLSSWTLL